MENERHCSELTKRGHRCKADGKVILITINNEERRICYNHFIAKQKKEQRASNVLSFLSRVASIRSGHA